MASTATTALDAIYAVSSGRMIKKQILWKKGAILFLIVLAIWLLKEKNHHTNEYELAVWGALERHEPSLRIYRSLLELNLLLWGVVFSLGVWYRYIGKDPIAKLLFEVPSWKDGPIKGYHHNHNNDTDPNNDHHHLYEYKMVAMGGDDFDNPMEQDDEHQEEYVEATQLAMEEEEGDDDDDDDDEINDDKNAVVASKMKKTKKMTKGNNNNNNNNNKNNNTNQEDCVTISPSISYVASMAFDMLVAILVSLFLFTFASAEANPVLLTSDIAQPNIHDSTTATSTATTTTMLATSATTAATTATKRTISQIFAMFAAPVFPLLLFVYLIALIVVPWKKRKHIWIILSWTMGAPYHPVTFRDGFVGDILTSTVRPMQDIAFTLCYILTGLQGWWSQSYFDFHLFVDDDTDENAIDSATTGTTATGTDDSFNHHPIPALEKSWILHTVLLPMCMVSPLWWRFLQNLRQAYDSKKRWPYLGNALKYFIAAEVAMFGVFDPTRKQTVLWISSFVLATLYQVWWDVCMDWELFTVNHHHHHHHPNKVTLRSKRLYGPNMDWMYWTIFGINFILRFCWTLSFLPPRYLNHAGVLRQTYHPGELSRILSPAIASAEIIRRTLWGLLRVELETIKVTEKQRQEQQLQQQQQQQQPFRQQLTEGRSDEEGTNHPSPPMDCKGLELQPMQVGGGEQRQSPSSQLIVPMPTTLGGALSSSATTRLWIANDMSALSDLQILGELCVYATAFTSLGIIAAAHHIM